MPRDERRDDDILPPFKVKKRAERPKKDGPGEITGQARRAQRNEQGALEELSRNPEVDSELRAIARELLREYPDITVPEEEIASMALDVFGRGPLTREVADRRELFKAAEIFVRRMVRGLREQSAVSIAIKRRAAREVAEKDLDTSADYRYREDDTLTPKTVPGESAPEKSPAEVIEELRRENEALQAELEAANDRIAELEERLGDDELEASRSRTQAEVEALLDQPSLEGIPLLPGGSFEEQWQQFEANYGRWLKHFGAEYDQISLPAIRAHDPNGIQRLSELLSKRRKKEREEHGDAKTPTLGQIVPKESDRGDRLLAGRAVEEVLADKGLARLLYSRIGSLLGYK